MLIVEEGATYVWVGLGNVHNILAGPPLYTNPLPDAMDSALKAWISGQYMPMSNKPAMKEPKIWEKM